MTTLDDSHAIVLLHGAGLGSWIWEEVTPHLPAPVVAIDLPGRAGVERPGSGLDLDACAELVADRIDRLGATSVTLVAHSVTGALALQELRLTPLALGGALFLISDLILGYGIFQGQLWPEGEPVWLTYGPGQMLIVFSIGAMVTLLPDDE